MQQKIVKKSCNIYYYKFLCNYSNDKKISLNSITLRIVKSRTLLKDPDGNNYSNDIIP